MQDGKMRVIEEERVCVRVNARACASVWVRARVCGCVRKCVGARGGGGGVTG